MNKGGFWNTGYVLFLDLDDGYTENSLSLHAYNFLCTFLYKHWIYFNNKKKKLKKKKEAYLLNTTATPWNHKKTEAKSGGL